MQIGQFQDLLCGFGIKSGSGVPCSYFSSVVSFMETREELDYLPATSEGEAVAIAAGLVTGGRPAFALMQNSGLGNAVNPITSMLAIYQMPVLLFISHRGEPGGSLDEPQHEVMGKITPALAELCGLRVHRLSDTSFRQTLAQAVEDRVPTAWIVGEKDIEGGAKSRPSARAVRCGDRALPKPGSWVGTLSREAALRATLPFLNSGGTDRPAVISTTGKLSRELFELDDRGHDRDNRFYMVGSMGCAAAFGLGVARARPRRTTIVLDGDGAILMKLGTLATIGDQSPANFHHVVFDNQAHDTTGGQRTVSATVDLATIAIAAGYRKAATVCDEREYQEVLSEHLQSEGPTFLRMMIAPGARRDLGRPTISPRAVHSRFATFLVEAPV
ncbi:MAG: phosphonopyruvate decarboxylase [Deltaproteobacteria bacterium]|nr:phosphonopyruvate decarboxylase [Deltaproteobacteria bacterium]